MINCPIPKLLPVTVPWKIDPGAPYLTLQTSSTGEPVSATFVAYFKLDELAAKATRSTEPVIASEPAEFEPRSLELKAAFRLVRVFFMQGRAGRVCRAFADHEVVREADFDWEAVASSPRPDEPPEMTVRRVRDLWVMTGICPDPCMYEVEDSPWLRESGISDPIWHHYLLLGHDDYVEVIAQSWKWEVGQPVA